MTGLVVVAVTEQGKAWDAFATRQVGFTHCHRWAWGGVLLRTMGHKVTTLAAIAPDGTWSGVLPLVSVRSPLFGRYLVSMPFLNYGGPLGTDEAIRLLVEAATTQAVQERADLLELRSRVSLAIDLEASHRKITVVMPLPAQPDRLLGGFDAKLRSQVRRPEKAGLVARCGAGLVDDFYRVFTEHMRDLGTPVLPRSLFHETAAAFGDDAEVIVVYAGARPVAAGLGIRTADEFELVWASALQAFNRDSPNMLLYRTAMESAIVRGVPLFNFGRCSVGVGTHRFKRQWTGSVDVPLYWYQKGEGVRATPSPSDAKFAWGPRLWRRLPLSVANLLGPAVVRGIP